MIAEAMRRRRRGGVATVVLGVLALAAAYLAALVDTERDERLEASGVRAPGVVLRAWPPSIDSPGKADVRFQVDGVERVRTLNWASFDTGVQVGDQVTVMYDPADPEQLHIAELSNDPLWWTLLIGASAVAGLVLIPVGVVRTRRWARHAAATGWRRGTASFVKEAEDGIEVTVRFDDGGSAVVAYDRPMFVRRPELLADGDVKVVDFGWRGLIWLPSVGRVMPARVKDWV